MNVRQRTEEIERMTFAPWATFSDQSRGRMVQEEQDPIRPVFQRDRDRVLHCKAFRRLKQKTQEEFMEVSGVGKAKSQRNGEVFLADNAEFSE